MRISKTLTPTIEKMLIVAVCSLLVLFCQYTFTSSGERLSTSCYASTTEGQISRPSSADADSQVLLLVDQSGSMIEGVGWARKIDHVKRGLVTFLDSLPDSQRIGLRVLGTGPGCVSTELLVPIASGNIARLKEAIGHLAPIGDTPLAYALERSLQDLDWKLKGKKVIVLFSDGLDTCKGNPCEVIEKVKREHPDIEFRIDVVAVIVDKAAQAQLRCLADLTGGKFINLDEKALEEFGRGIGEFFGRMMSIFYPVIALLLGTASLLLASEMCYELLTCELKAARTPTGVIVTLGFFFLEALILGLIF